MEWLSKYDKIAYRTSETRRFKLAMPLFVAHSSERQLDVSSLPNIIATEDEDLQELRWMVEEAITCWSISSASSKSVTKGEPEGGVVLAEDGNEDEAEDMAEEMEDIWRRLWRFRWRCSVVWYEQCSHVALLRPHPLDEEFESDGEDVCKTKRWLAVKVLKDAIPEVTCSVTGDSLFSSN